MADTPKPEYVDIISEATRQNRRRVPRIVDLPTTATKQTSRLGHWPPEHGHSGGWRR